MTITYQYRHLGKPNPVHRATEPATAPIGQEAPEIAAPHMPSMSMHLTRADCDAETREQLALAIERIARLWDRIRKVEHDNNQAAARILQLESDLLECREYLEDHVDVVDGDYGQPAPNKAMRLVTMIDQTLGSGR